MSTGGGAARCWLRCLANKCAIKLIEIALCLFVQQFVAKQISLAGRRFVRRKSFSGNRISAPVCDRERKREGEEEGQSVHCGVQTILLSWSSSEVATKRRQTAKREREEGKQEEGKRDILRVIERGGEKGTVTEEGRLVQFLPTTKTCEF